MEIRYLADPVRFESMTTKELRATFLVRNLFEAGKLTLLYCDADRAVIGGVVPGREPVELKGGKELASDFFAQRRELGVINIGQAGTVIIDGKEFKLQRLEGLYIGRGAKQILFVSADSKSPAEFYFQSYPAHKEYATRLVRQSAANKVELGTAEAANMRTIYQYIRPGIAESCQLVMGLTILAPGSVWNTFPPHTHARRTEIYLYFDLDREARVFHLIGAPDATRHLVIENKEAVLSPSWSIHSGVGSSSYTFIWGMGGENQDFDDMDFIPIESIK